MDSILTRTETTHIGTLVWNIRVHATVAHCITFKTTIWICLLYTTINYNNTNSIIQTVNTLELK